MLNGNPAARLLDILIEARDQSRSENTLNVWGNIFKTNGNIALTYERLAKMMRLSEETYKVMLALFPKQSRPTSYWKSVLDKAFQQQNMLAGFHTFADNINDIAIDHLTSAVDLLDLKIPDPLSSADIDSHIEILNSLILEILEGDLELKVKEYLVRSLRSIVTALQEYRLSGKIPVTEAIEQALGHSFFDKEYFSALQTTDLGKKVLGALGDLANAVTVATPIVTLLLTDSVRQTLGLQG
ncbi:hypothetical protein ACW9IO_23875 [Pseudomonas azotoformans]